MTTSSLANARRDQQSHNRARPRRATRASRELEPPGTWAISPDGTYERSPQTDLPKSTLEMVYRSSADFMNVWAVIFGVNVVDTPHLEILQNANYKLEPVKWEVCKIMRPLRLDSTCEILRNRALLYENDANILSLVKSGISTTLKNESFGCRSRCWYSRLRTLLKREQFQLHRRWYADRRNRTRRGEGLNPSPRPFCHVIFFSWIKLRDVQNI